MSAAVYSGTHANVNFVNTFLYLHGGNVDNIYGVRPLVSLKNGTSISTVGNGSLANPFRVTG